MVWLALVYWTFADARRRIADPMLVGCATAASLFPFIGTIVYLIVRPPEYLEDVRERELEIAAAAGPAARASSTSHCQYCGFEVEKAFLRCPSCLRRLKEPCTVCGKPLDPRWKICPYCEAEVGQAAPRRPAGRDAPAARPPRQCGGAERAARQRVRSARRATRAPPRPAERPARRRSAPAARPPRSPAVRRLNRHRTEENPWTGP